VEIGRPVGRGADDATVVAADPVPEAALVRPDESLPEQRPHRGADDRGGKGSIWGPIRMNPAPPMASEVRIRLPRFPSERTASSTTQQSPARGEVPCSGDHRWATTAPTPEARDVVETWRKASIKHRRVDCLTLSQKNVGTFRRTAAVKSCGIRERQRLMTRE
jgi:hypothetical protein